MSQVPEEQLPADYGKYRLEKRIATGGMAEIFLAHRLDKPLEPLVIKRILPHLSKSPEFVTMFLDEARIAAQLRHTNVVAIEDMGQINGAYYIAMEYVHGEDIRRIYNRAYKLQRSLPLSHSIRVIADAALGLGHAHKLTDFTGKPLGLVHRDVSPQNILVTYEGDAKVVDFGIAKAANKVAQTRAGVLKGKYSYMSPEQALGDPMDHRTDIFALGIILYETTTGTRLFKRHNELATLQAIIKCEYMPPSEALPGYPHELEEILLRALARRPEDRYDDAEELSAALYDFLHESGLYVEREVVAAFMKDLFSDRLAEEEGSGEPAVPSAEEVKEELGGPQPKADDVPSKDVLKSEDDVSPENTDADLEARATSGTVQDRGRRATAGPGFPARGGSMDDSHTAPETDEEDVPRGFEPQVLPPDAAELRRKSTDIARPGVPPPSRSNGETNGAVLGEAKTAVPMPADLLPTVAAHPSYRPPAKALEPPPAKPPVVAPPPSSSSTPEREVEPEKSLMPKKGSERTERVRAREPRFVAEETQEEIDRRASIVAAGSSGRTVMLIGLSVMLVLLAVLTGVLTSRALRQKEHGPVSPSGPSGKAIATRPSGRIVVSTEPGAEVFVAGERLGVANESGIAGPFDLAPGEALVRVTSTALGFERQRSITLEAGHTYDFEIRARQGWLRVLVAPWGKVTIDGKPFGLTPLPRLPLLEGIHKVTLENPDIGRRHTTTIRVAAGEEAELKVDLKDAGEEM